MLNVLYFFVASLKITTKLISKVLDCHDKFRFATLSDTLEPCPTGLKIFNASLNFLKDFESYIFIEILFYYEQKGRS